jgi:hypothetical protein
VQIEHRLIQNFLDVGAVEIDGELGDVRGGWRICSREEITELALVGRPDADGWDASAYTVPDAPLYVVEYVVAVGEDVPGEAEVI